MSARDGIPPPRPFRGTRAEDPEQWLNNFRLWAAFKKLTNADKEAALPLLLQDAARQWHDALTPEQQRHDAVFDQFELRYFRREHEKQKDLAKLFESHQKPDQPVEDFLTEVTVKAVRSGASEGMLFSACLNGVRANIRQFLIQKDVKNIDDLRRYAVIAEEASPAGEDIAEMIRAMQKQLNAVVAPVTQPPPPPPPPQPQPRQEQFGGQRGFPSRRGQRGGRFNDRNQQAAASNEQRPWSRGQRGRPTGNNYRQEQPRQEQSGTERLIGPCLQCGWEHPQGQCPAKFSVCRKCGRTSHWARMCWSKVQPQAYSQH
jgi:hypothetical protein